MTGSGETRHDFVLDVSIPAAPLESIPCTEDLHRRPSRPPDYEKENRARVNLVSALADSPDTILQTLAETILSITQCDSAGLSLLTKDGKTADVCGNRFYWLAIAGMWNPHVGGGTPSIAHELNQPLSGIIINKNTCLQMLPNDSPDVARARDSARRTLRDGDRAAAVTARVRAEAVATPSSRLPGP
jgi:hypothetical protein